MPLRAGLASIGRRLRPFMFSRSVFTTTNTSEKHKASSRQIIDDLFSTKQSNLYSKAIELLDNDYKSRYTRENPLINHNNNQKFIIDDLRNTKDAIIHHLSQNTETVAAHSMFHMSIPGSHSIVLHINDDVMIRLYVTPPHQMHVSHVNWSVPFLRHAHRYNFLSIPIEGCLINQRSQEASNGDRNATRFRKYNFFSPVLNSKVQSSTLQYEKDVNLSLFPFEICPAGQGYMMDFQEIHRVGFIPRTLDDWSVILFLEYRDQVKESRATYSRHFLKETPDLEKLYKKPTTADLETLINQLIRKLKSPALDTDITFLAAP